MSAYIINPTRMFKYLVRQIYGFCELDSTTLSDQVHLTFYFTIGLMVIVIDHILNVLKTCFDIKTITDV